ncbi:heavy metal-associated isoprenylated plant protein 3-like [Neltuma alba]|uniref:heavy metal-associated isoprenylated plant protein 3-like n=1 Tax=Neltuma alba TaxID=207710 RepID=UPI0010A51CB1|nr:heavy metal-associated isoprenylated plant protein 3-like [Prosopis alba]
MSLKSTNRKMRRGFMCHSQASTAVCMSTADRRSVVVPRRPERSIFLDDTRLINYPKYSKLVEPLRFEPVDKKALAVAAPKMKQKMRERGQDEEKEPRAVHQAPTDQVFQVVVMKVALHCQGCAGKVKKHLSKMEGVTSFSVDLETKRVTVMGHISPVGVLESISKVKRAEFWPC